MRSCFRSELAGRSKLRWDEFLPDSTAPRLRKREGLESAIEVVVLLPIGHEIFLASMLYGNMLTNNGLDVESTVHTLTSAADHEFCRNVHVALTLQSYAFGRHDTSACFDFRP